MHNQTYSPGLWLDLASLVQRCDTVTYARGLELYRNQRVLELGIDQIDDYWVLKGAVQGSQRYPYRLTIEVKRAANGCIVEWDADCSCPVGYQCKHGVALLIKAAYQGQQILTGRRSLPSKPSSAEQLQAQRAMIEARVREFGRLEAETQVTSWLDALDRAAPVAPSAAPPDLRPAAKPVQRVEQFLYLLSIVNAQSSRPLLALEVVQSYQKINGGWAKAKASRIQPEKGQSIFDQASLADHEVIQLMCAMPSLSTGYYYSYANHAKVTPAGRYGVEAIELAAGTGRLYVSDARGQPAVPAQWGPVLNVQWEWHEVTRAQASDSSWTLRAKLPGDCHLCLNDPPLYLNLASGACGPVQASGLSAAQLAVLLQAPTLKGEALKSRQADLLQRLGSVPLPPVLENLTKLSGITPSVCLALQRVAPEQVSALGLVQGVMRFDYAGHRGWWVGQGSTVLVNDASTRLLLERDPASELEAVMRLSDLGLSSDGKGTFGIPGSQSQQLWLRWADCDYAPLRQTGFDITLDASLEHWISRADKLAVDLSAQGADETTSPWFNLSLGMEIDGVRRNILPWLPELLSVVAQSPLDAQSGVRAIPAFVYLPDSAGGFIRLPTDSLQPWLTALLELVGERSHDFSAEHLKLSRFAALRTTAALGEGAVWAGSEHLREMLQRLSGRTDLPAVALPKSVVASLRPYQQQGVNWLQFLREYGLSGILADDMGLGKTLQTLVHIQLEKDAGRLTHPALIIAPVSLMGNWQREAARFCPDLRSLVLHGQGRHEVADQMSQNDIVIAPYSLLHRDRQRWLNAKWHLVVLDEAQNIKNANTHAAQVVSELTSQHRLCLSGTPMENHLGEIWSLFHFLMPGFLGSQKRFTELFRTPIEKRADAEALQQLRARVTPFMLRRSKALVASELPPKMETVLRVELSGKQADLYETIRLGMEKAVREALDTRGLAKSHITILDALLKLRQVCCDPHLLKLSAAQKVKESAKLEQLMSMLPEMLAEGRRVLLFSQFTSMLSLIEEELRKHAIKWVKLTGQSQQRDALIEQFTSGAVPLFLISLKAGGVGLNLPQADTVIHYDPWWNPAVENQATDRAHRIGQTQRLWVVKLVVQGTIEERILALQERKAALAQSVYSGALGRKQPLFSESDLAELLKPLG